MGKRKATETESTAAGKKSKTDKKGEGEGFIFCTLNFITSV